MLLQKDYSLDNAVAIGISESNKTAWERRSRQCGASLRGVLFKGAPDAFNKHIHDWHRKIILDAVDQRGPRRILDVGCGYGRLSLEILKARPDADIVGSDVSRTYVDLYRRLTSKPAIEMGIEKRTEPLGTFDFVICATVLMYLAHVDLVPAMSNLLSYLKADGKLILIEPDRSGVPFQNCFGFLPRLGAPGPYGNPVGVSFNRDQIHHLVHQAGGKVFAERRIPATTFFFLPMAAIGKIGTAVLRRRLYDVISRWDELLTNRHLPSLYVSYVVGKTSGFTVGLHKDADSVTVSQTRQRSGNETKMTEEL